MSQPTRRLVDLTLEELEALLDEKVAQAVQRAVRGFEEPQKWPQSALLEITPLSIGQWNHDTPFIRRDEYYDDL